MLLGFGMVDDRQALRPRIKFVGQLIAVLPMVLFADLYVTHFPLLHGRLLPISLAMPFTVFAVVGMINAVNTSDGLDGLAGGEVLVSLLAIAALAFFADSNAMVIMAMAAAGGLFGFLRYNTSPAWIFMGDSGSQFLGFSVGFLVVVLTQRVDTAMSPAAALLLLGLPVADLLVVSVRRMRRGASIFSPDKDHLHHRLLRLGFTRQRSVVIIYSVQTLLVGCGVFLGYRSDWLLLSIYVAVCVALFGATAFAERVGWNALNGAAIGAAVTGRNNVEAKGVGPLVWGPRRFLEITVPLYLLFGVGYATDVPKDFTLTSIAAMVLWGVQFFVPVRWRGIPRRGVVYIVAATVAYLLSYHAAINDVIPRRLEMAFLGMVAVAIAVAIKFSPRRRQQEFHTTALDYLVIFVALVALAASGNLLTDRASAGLIVRIVVLLYACEVMIVERRQRWDTLGAASVVVAFVAMLRALL